jgi:CheY-like chemotaxis protein
MSPAAQLPLFRGMPESGELASLKAFPHESAPQILVVDDEASVRLGCVMALRSDGWRAVGEASSPAALQRLTSGNDHYDVVVLDYAMPELDGLALAGVLDPQTRPPILLASAHADGAVALAALRLGIWDFQAKPLVPDELRRRVQRLHTRARDAAVPTAWMPRALQHCQRGQWADALMELRALPEAERTETGELLIGLVCQLAGDEAGAREAFHRARWWPDWHRQGGEIWAELARRLG